MSAISLGVSGMKSCGKHLSLLETSLTRGCVLLRCAAQAQVLETAADQDSGGKQQTRAFVSVQRLPQTYTYLVALLFY